MDTEIAEEYNTWRKNVPYNYDLLITHALAWPSLTCQWYPTADRVEDSTVQNVLLCTHTSNADQEYILIAGIAFPDSLVESADNASDAVLTNTDGKVRMVMEIPVSDEVNRARFSPFAHHVIATRSDSSAVAVYDTSRQPAFGRIVAKPDLTLIGHSQGGFGLSWSTTNNGMLLTTGEDGLVCIYDVNANRNKTEISPIKISKAHSSVVGDGAWSFFAPNIMATVGDDRRLIIHDVRVSEPVSVVENAHRSDVFCVAYSAIEDSLLATGGKDGNINVWDERKLISPIKSLKTDNNEILQVQWSPHLGSFLASAGTDRRVRIWDLNSCEISGDSNDGPPELKFLHSGHTNSVCDLSWNPLEPMELCSVAEDNIMQIWQTTQSDIPFDLDD